MTLNIQIFGVKVELLESVIVTTKKYQAMKFCITFKTVFSAAKVMPCWFMPEPLLLFLFTQNQNSKSATPEFNFFLLRSVFNLKPIAQVGQAFTISPGSVECIRGEACPEYYAVQYCSEVQSSAEEYNRFNHTNRSGVLLK